MKGNDNDTEKILHLCIVVDCINYYYCINCARVCTGVYKAETTFKLSQSYRLLISIKIIVSTQRDLEPHPSAMAPIL